MGAAFGSGVRLAIRKYGHANGRGMFSGALDQAHVRGLGLLGTATQGTRRGHHQRQQDGHHRV